MLVLNSAGHLENKMIKLDCDDDEDFLNIFFSGTLEFLPWKVVSM